MLNLAADILAALGHANRLKIIHLIREGHDRPGKLTGEMGVSSPFVTHHLNTLDHAGVVSRRKVGREVFLTVNEDLISKAVACLQNA